MRTIEPESFEVFSLDELSEDAQERAVEAIAAKLGGDWWDSDDNDDISNVIVYALAEKLGAPGWDFYGVGDFPGISGVKLEEWDDRGRIGVRGGLDRENAPALPWADGVVEARLTPVGFGRTEVDIHVDEDELDPEQERDLTVVRAECQERAAVVAQAIEEALSEALSAGHREIEYKTSEQYAREHIEANGLEFLADGSLYG
jgi:hypothetical protein